MGFLGKVVAMETYATRGLIIVMNIIEKVNKAFLFGP